MEIGVLTLANSPHDNDHQRRTSSILPPHQNIWDESLTKVSI